VPQRIPMQTAVGSTEQTQHGFGMVRENSSTMRVFRVRSWMMSRRSHNREMAVQNSSRTTRMTCSCTPSTRAGLQPVPLFPAVAVHLQPLFKLVDDDEHLLSTRPPVLLAKPEKNSTRVW